jgi:glycosyltransferase involved in cell wall biosynthesis
MTPDVSVLTAVRNGEPYLAEAIDSVIAQNVTLEHIVVDDGSIDNTAGVVERYGDRIRYHRQPPLGAAAALNAALSRATAPYVAFLDADDIMTSGRLTRQSAVLNSNPDCAMTFGAFREFLSGVALQGRWSVRAEAQTGYITGAAMMRREVLQKIAGFNEALTLGWFVDLVMRAREAGAQEIITQDLVLLRRVHGANTTITQNDRRGDYFAVARAALARRRSG